METLTIVVPIYNVADYLPQCLDSLLNQTVRDHRAILVDDGSTDGSGRIADGYAAAHPEMFTVIHKENGGLSSARNAGFAQVETPYVTFLDSDDWETSDFVENVCARLAELPDGVDILLNLPLVYDQANGVTAPFKDEWILHEIFTPEDRVTNVEETPRLFDLEVSCCRRVLRTAFARESGLFFPEGVHWEDVVPHFRLMKRAKRVAAMGGHSFYYRVNRPGQITAGSGRSRLEMPAVFTMLLDMVREEKWSREHRAHALSTMHVFMAWSHAVVSGDLRREFLTLAHALYRRVSAADRRAYFKICCPTRREKILFFAFRSALLCAILKDEHRCRYLYDRGRRIFHKIRRG